MRTQNLSKVVDRSAELDSFRKLMDTRKSLILQYATEVLADFSAYDRHSLRALQGTDPQAVRPLQHKAFAVAKERIRARQPSKQLDATQVAYLNQVCSLLEFDFPWTPQTLGLRVRLCLPKSQDTLPDYAQRVLLLLPLICKSLDPELLLLALMDSAPILMVHQDRVINPPFPASVGQDQAVVWTFSGRRWLIVGSGRSHIQYRAFEYLFDRDLLLQFPALPYVQDALKQYPQQFSMLQL